MELINNESIFHVSIEVTLVEYKVEEKDGDKEKGNDKECDEMAEKKYTLEEIKLDYILVKEKEKHNYKILKIDAEETEANLRTMIENESETETKE